MATVWYNIAFYYLLSEDLSLSMNGRRAYVNKDIQYAIIILIKYFAGCRTPLTRFRG